MSIMTKIPGFPIINVMLIGNSGVGKGSLKMRYRDGYFPEVVPKCYHPCEDLKKFKDTLFYLDIHEVEGSELYDRLRPIVYANLTENIVALMCYSINDVASFNRLKSVLIEEVRQYYFTQKIPMILLGMKSDLEKDDEHQPHVSQKFVSTEKDKEHQPYITKKMAQHLASEMGIPKSLTCSALTGEGVATVFDTAISMSDLFRKVASPQLTCCCNIV